MADDENRLSDEPGGLSTATRRDGTEEYTVRPFRPGDRETYLTLHEDVFGIENTSEWFAWKYERNPFVDRVPITVAERDGKVVGAVSAFPLEMHTGTRVVRVYISCEGFVHPEHRRRGVFTRMVSAAWERYADDMAFVTGLSANEKTLSAHVKYNDWRVVQTVPRYYRFQRPDVLLGSRADSRILDALGKLSLPAVKGYFEVRSGIGRRATADVSVERFDETPVELLVSLYREHAPREIHAVRDETLYGWRFENPNWEYTTYVARVGSDSPVAAVVAGTRTRDRVTELRLVDALPLSPDRDEAAFEPLLDAVLEDNADAALVVALPGTLSDRVLSTFGFVRQDRFPLSRVSEPIYHGVHPLGPSDDADLSLDQLTTPSNWLLTYVEHDAS